jgi:hypothetical protein
VVRMAKLESMVDSMVEIKVMLTQMQHFEHWKLPPKELVYTTHLYPEPKHINLHPSPNCWRMLHVPWCHPWFNFRPPLHVLNLIQFRSLNRSIRSLWV